jgi:hypothetical protein
MLSQQSNNAHDWHKAIWFDRAQSSAAPIHDAFAERWPASDGYGTAMSVASQE